MHAVGEKFAHYTIEAMLGRGGMGEVYRAFDSKLHRRVALKLLLAPEGASEEDRTAATARMIREARAAAALDHPNKVSVFELGEVDGVPYIAMEYIAGSTLRAYLAADAAPRMRKLSWLVDVARALEAAHVAGLVHRDIKPENVMVGEHGIVKVLDFGIARRLDAPADAAALTAPATDPLTGKGGAVGTAAYMAPEQMRGHDLDGRADQFAWGVLAFELLTGRHPWKTEGSSLALVTAMLTTPAPRLSTLWPDAPDAVDAAIARALSPKREDRFPKMADLSASLAGVLERTTGDASLAVEGARPATVVLTPPTTGSVGTTTRAAVSMAPTELQELPSRARRTRAVAPAAAAMVVAAALGLGGWRYLVMRTHLVYCVDFVPTVDGDECRVEADPKTMYLRRETHRLTYVGGHVVKRENLNTAGLFIRRALVEYVRGNDGAIQQVVTTKEGKEVSRELWRDGGKTVDLVEADGKTPRLSRDVETPDLPVVRDTVITRLHRVFDSRGYLVRETGEGVSGNPRVDENGVFGVEHERDATGFATKSTYLGWDGKPMADARGIAFVVRRADATGLEAEARYFDADGRPATADGAHLERVDTSAPRLTQRELYFFGRSYFDAAGKPTFSLKTGAHHVSFLPDGTGRKFELHILDDKGQPWATKGTAIATMIETLDERGLQAALSYFDVDGNPVTSPKGDAAQRMVNDADGYVVELHVLDASGKPTLEQRQFATAKDTWDARHDHVARLFLDEAGAPMKSVKWSFDDRGEMVDGTAFDAHGAPMVMETGAWRWRLKRDRLRNVVGRAYDGTDGEPCIVNEGYSSVTQRFDDDGLRVEQAFFDTTGAPTYKGGEYAARRWQRDEHGFEVEEASYDANGNLTLTSGGYAIRRSVRDRDGDVIEEAYFGKHEEPIATAGGVAKKRHAYDVRRRRVETALLDPSGAPVVGPDGFAVERVTYDDRGLVARVDHLGAAEKPALDAKGSASSTTTYDARGNKVEESYLGVDGAPIVAAVGYATKRSAYDRQDRLVEESLFDASGAPMMGKQGWALRRLRYDAVGDVVEESFLDAERRPVVAKQPAYASMRQKYDSRRAVLETAYFDPDGAPAKGPDGVEMVRYARDAFGRATETRYLDALGDPATSSDGKQVVIARFDAAGHVVDESFVDASGAPLRSRDGCAAHATRYDERGRKVEETCVDEHGALAVGTAGWASRRTLHDGRGNVVDDATYGADGKLLADDSGVARRKYRYDERNLRLEATFYGADDKPAKDNRGVASVRYAYDDARRPTRETLLDDKGNVVVPPASRKPSSR